MVERAQDIIRVVAAVIQREGRFLVCKRPSHKRHGGLWEFPGGKLKSGETVIQAARRELQEELGLVLTGIGGALFSQLDPGSKFQIEFVEVWADGEPQPLEHDELRWLRSDELMSVSLAPTDAMFVTRTQQSLGGRHGE